MAFSNALRIQLEKAIQSYQFPLVTFDFEDSRRVVHRDVLSLELAVREDLVSGNLQRVEYGLCNVLYWGFARKPGLQMNRVETFRSSVRPSQLENAGRLFQRIQGTGLGRIKGIGLPQFSNMSFVSKIRMFLDPNNYVVLDLKLCALGRQQQKNLFHRLTSRKTYIPISERNEGVYEEWCKLCRAIADMHYQGTGIRAVDVERGIFHLVDSGRQSIAAEIICSA